MNGPRPPAGVRAEWPDGVTVHATAVIHVGQDTDGTEMWEALLSIPEGRSLLEASVLLDELPGNTQLSLTATEEGAAEQ